MHWRNALMQYSNQNLEFAVNILPSVFTTNIKLLSIMVLFMCYYGAYNFALQNFSEKTS